jgi:hypothetical protein
LFKGKNGIFGEGGRVWEENRTILKKDKECVIVCLDFYQFYSDILYMEEDVILLHTCR